MDSQIHASADASKANASSLHSAVAWVKGHERIVALVLIAILAIQITPKFELNPDGVNYMSIARNLAWGRGWARLGSPHIHYAPGYAVAISPIFWFGQRPFVMLGILHLIFATILMALTYLWLARYLGRDAMLVTLLTMVNVGFWDLYRQPSAEMFFMPCVMGAAVLLAIAVQTRQPRRAAAAIAGGTILVMISCATRQLGVFLVVGFTTALLVRAMRRELSWRRAAAAAAVIGLFAAVVTLSLAALDRHGARLVTTGTVTYIQLIHTPGQTIAGQILEGIRRQSAEVGRLLMPGMFKASARAGEWLNINTLITSVIFIFTAIGWWKFVKRTNDPLALSFPFYFAFCVIYPLDSGTRFTVPMLPVLAVAAWFAMEGLGKERAGIFLVLVVAHLAVSIGTWLHDLPRIRAWYRQWPAIEQVAAGFPPEANDIAVRDVDYERWLFLMYLADRQVAPEFPGEAVGPYVEWLLTPATMPDSPGFHMVRRLQDLKLERRNSPAN